jgi:hypothetical protein
MIVPRGVVAKRRHLPSSCSCSLSGVFFFFSCVDNGSGSAVIAGSSVALLYLK